MFTNKNVLITGGSSGIGLATVNEFAQLGANVYVIDRNPINLEQLPQKNLTNIEFIYADIANYHLLQKAFNHFKAKKIPLDVLIANAGISRRNQFINITRQQWRKVIQTNLDGVFFSMQFAARQMVQQGYGILLATASTNAFKAHQLYADYNITKAGVISLVKTLALELAPSIRVNAVAPGYVLTPMQLEEYTSEMLAAVNQSLPLERHARPEEIAKLFCYLASEAAAYITGQVITIDGGETV